MNRSPRVRVYRNLTRKCLSVQTYQPGKGWRLAYHTHDIYLRDAEFTVSEAGRQRVLGTGRKNVHAFITGTMDMPFLLEHPGLPPEHTPKPVTYNPRRDMQFTFRDTGEAIIFASRVFVSTDRGILATRRGPAV